MTETQYMAILKPSKLRLPGTFPAIGAYRDGRLIGYVATQEREDAVVVDHLWVSPEIGHRAFVCVRLMEHYDSVLRSMGVVEYLAHVEADNWKWAHCLKRLGGPVSELGRDPEDAGYWFRRRLD